ncbi:MAG: SDR family oxidoreductase [Deltaproteobacteria bacterium]|nr:SDR family oxidoreductase [Deltaproteobacteria bacterium]
MSPFERSQKSPLPIRETLRGKHVLVTGFTGFLGKVLVSMLLERAPEIGRITLLARGKKTQPAAKRVRHLFERSPGLRNLREIHGEGLGSFLASRVDVVAGDVRDPLCGIDPRVVDRLGASIDCVIHVAGLTDFEPDPLEGVAVNVRGALHAADLAARTRGRRLLHVSTSFVAGNVSGPVPELLEPGLSANGTRFSPRDELASMESLCDATSKRFPDPVEAKKARIERGTLRAQALGWPNLYTYTKALGEHLVAMRGDVESTFVRPSIVECARELPFRGWNEGVNTSGPLVWLVGTVHRRMPFAEDHCFDVVPVDSVARGTIVALAELMRGEHARVYQLASGDTNRFTFGRAVDLTSLVRRREYARSDDAFERLVLRHLDSVVHDRAADQDPWLPAAKKLTRGVRDLFSAFKAEHHLPSAVRERFGTEITKFAQRQAKEWGSASRTIGQVVEMLRMFQPFVFDNDIELETHNVRRASERVGAEERALFGWDLASLDWRDYWMNVHIPGLDKWSLPLMHGERIPEDPVFSLDTDLLEHTTREDDPSERPRALRATDLRAHEAKHERSGESAAPNDAE